METLLTIVQTTVPALVVFATVYVMLKNYLDQQYKLQVLSLRQKNTKHSIPLKLQAYERMTMLCERINIPNLILRLRTKEMSAVEITNSMILAVQQEYDHNLTQQVYITDQLWDIVTLAKNEVLNEISSFSSLSAPQDNARVLIDKIKNIELSSVSAIKHSKRAIKEELNLHMV